MPRIGLVTMLFQVTENIMTVESLLELPHKLLLGNVLLPDMEVALTDEQLFMDRLIICQTNFHLLAITMSTWRRTSGRGGRRGSGNASLDLHF